MIAPGPLPMSERWNNRALFRLLWPLIIEQILAMSMGTADTLMISLSGEAAMSGVNIIVNINQLLIIAFIAMSTGGAVVCSQYIGRQDYNNSRLAAKQLVYIVSLISLVITVLSLVFRQSIITLFYGRLESDVMEAAMIYFLLSALSYPLLGFYNACAALLRSSGDSKTPMLISVLINILHIGCNFIFLYGFNLGIIGLGLSGLISRSLTVLIPVLKLVKSKDSPVSLSGIMTIKFVPAMAKRIFNIGIPASLEQSMFQMGRLITQRIFASFGTSVMAANAVAGAISSVAFMGGNAYIVAITTVVGQCIGAGDYSAARRYTHRLVKYTWISVASVSVLAFIFRSSLIGFFNLSPEASAYANSFLMVISVFMALAWATSFAPPAALRAAGDARFVMLVGIVSMWFGRVLLAYLFTYAFGMGPMGVWLAQGIDFTFRSITFFLRWRSGRWQNIKVI